MTLTPFTKAIAAAAALAALLASPGCKSDTSTYDVLLASDMGIGIYLLENHDTVRSFMGEPTSTKEIQGQVNVEEFYIADGDTQEEGALLSLSYINGKLTRVHNRYDPLDEEGTLPPFFAEPISGVKLGNRLSGFIDALGPQTDSLITNSWRFEGQDGSTITVMAEFTDVGEAGDSLCTRLQVVYGLPAVQTIGEDQKKKKK